MRHRKENSVSERFRSYKIQKAVEGPLQRDTEEKKRSSFLDEHMRVIPGGSSTESTELRRGVETRER